VGRKRSERGASLVEFALLLPVLVLLLFGIIDFGSLYNNYQSVRQGSRDGLRQIVVTMPVANAPSCTTTGGNSNDDATAHGLLCYVKARVGLGDSARVRILWKGPPVGTPADINTFPATNPAMVCVQYPAQSLSGVIGPFINGKILSTQTETLIEQDGNYDLTHFLSAASAGFGDIKEQGLGDPNTNSGWPTSCQTSKL